MNPPKKSKKIPQNFPSIPADFDWEFYVERYPDLKRNGVDTKEKAEKHWINCGNKEGRIYKTKKKTSTVEGKGNKCVAIVTGMQRSGTTLFGKIINSHSEIFSGIECGILLGDLQNFEKSGITGLEESKWQFGLPKNYTEDIKTLDYSTIYDYISQHKGSYSDSENPNNPQNLIKSSNYFIDKAPRYIYALPSIHQKVQSLDIPIILVLKHFKDIYKSCCIKRNLPIERFMIDIQKTIKSLKFIEQNKPDNVFLFSYSRFIENKVAHTKELENILYKYNPQLKKEALSLEKFEKKIHQTQQGYKDEKWKPEKIEIGPLSPELSDVQKIYDKLLNRLSISPASIESKPPTNKKTLYIHIGTGKTGTTALQEFLIQNQQKGNLKKSDLKYCSSGLLKINHHELCKNFGRKNKEIQQRVDENILKLKTEIQNSSQKKFIISSENFPGLSHKEIKYLVDTVSSVCTVKMIVFLRRQDGFLSSWHSQSIKSMRTNMEIKNLKKQIYRGGIFNYQTLISKWEYAIGSENIKISIYNPKNQKENWIYDTFLKQVGVQTIPPNFVLPKKNINPSLSREQIYLLREMSEFWKLTDEERNILYCPLPISVKHKRNILSPEERKSIIQDFRETNRYVAQKYFQNEYLFRETIEDETSWVPTDILRSGYLFSFIRYIQSNPKLWPSLKAPVREYILSKKSNVSHQNLGKKYDRLLQLVDKKKSPIVDTSFQEPSNNVRDINVALVTTARNEGPYLLEWICYHKLLGFDDIYIYSHDNEDGSEVLLQKLHEIGLIHYVDMTGKLENNVFIQHTLLSRAIAKVKRAKKHDWVCVIDLDEFLNLKKHKTIQEFIQSCPSDTDGIFVNWQMFNSNDQLQKKTGLVIERFTQLGKPHHPGVKSIAKVDSILTWRNGHIPQYISDKKIKVIYPDGKPYTGNDVYTGRRQDKDNHFTPDIAMVHHYVVKSFEEFLIKSARGGGGDKGKDVKNPTENKYTAYQSVNSENNGSDESILDSQAYQSIHEYISSILKENNIQAIHDRIEEKVHKRLKTEFKDITPADIHQRSRIHHFFGGNHQNYQYFKESKHIRIGGLSSRITRKIVQIFKAHPGAELLNTKKINYESRKPYSGKNLIRKRTQSVPSTDTRILVELCPKIKPGVQKLWQKTFPDSYFIQVIMHPLTFGFWKLREQNKPINFKNISTAIREWISYYQNIQTQKKNFPNLHILKYEDLIENSEECLKQLFQNINAPQDLPHFQINVVPEIHNLQRWIEEEFYNPKKMTVLKAKFETQVNELGYSLDPRKAISTYQKQLFKVDSKNIHVIHIGKCAGSSVKATLRRNKILHTQIHNRKPVFSEKYTYIIPIRNPISRFVSAFNMNLNSVSVDLQNTTPEEVTPNTYIWPSRIIKAIKEKRGFVFNPEFDRLIKDFASANELAEALTSSNLQKKEKALLLMNSKIEHIYKGIGWYLQNGKFIEEHPNSILAVIRQEYFEQDMEALFQKLGVKLTMKSKMIHLNNWGYSKHLSEKAINNIIQFYKDTDYATLNSLYKHGFINSETLKSYYIYNPQD